MKQSVFRALCAGNTGALAAGGAGDKAVPAILDAARKLQALKP
jgi:hypothetical protein